MHDSINEVSGLIENLFTKREIKQNLLQILNALKTYGNLDSTHLIYLMRNILYAFSNRVDSQIIDLYLTQEEFELFYYELLKIIIELNKLNNQKINDKQLKQIITRFFLALNKTIKERKKHKEKLTLDSHSMRQIRENLRKAIIYEIYKFTNPKRIAGETRIENFINNILKGGIGYAKRFDFDNFTADKTKYTHMIKNQRNSGKNTLGK
ncbi:MAG: DUF5394 family protein [Rickettsiales endosymbiont of Dermacentor nuttalli]